MIRLIWTVSVHTRYFLRRYMPTNILLDAIRTRRGLKWGIPAMLLAVPYILIANVCVQLIEDGAPGWLHLAVLWAIWNRVIVKTCGSACHATCWWSPDSSGRSTSLPFSKVAPARTRATRCGALTARQRRWADSMSLNAMAMPAARDPGPLVTR